MPNKWSAGQWKAAGYTNLGNDGRYRTDIGHQMYQQNYDAKVLRRMSGVSDSTAAGGGMYLFIDNKELDRSVNELIKAMRKAYGRYLADKHIKDVFMSAGEQFRYSLYSEAPEYKGGVHYVSYKGNKRPRKVMPGNLKRSMTVFPGKDSLDVHIGPRTRRAKFGDKKADGFYGYWVNFGQGRHRMKKDKGGEQYVERAYNKTKQRASGMIYAGLRTKVDKFNRELNGTST